MVCFFFFKQRTAYEMRISDWSSDVCASDLIGARDPLPLDYRLPVPSAQVKSAVLLAGLNAPGETRVVEREATRDHSERMLGHFGAVIRRREIAAEGHRAQEIVLRGTPALVGRAVPVPADPSSPPLPRARSGERRV